MLSGRILITGGAGFLGRGIMRVAQEEGWPAQFTVYSRDEMKQTVARRQYPDARYILGDIKDTERLYAAMLGHDIVIHAGAVKFIPEAEFNVAECVAVNIDGSRSVIEAAVRANVDTVVAISTDKAVEPVNVYGATKFLMERLFSEAARMYGIHFTLTRYGNVIGSTGSVIPVFQHQAKVAGRILLTNPVMTRFWLSIHEAVELIETAATLANSGSIIVPRPKAMRMGDLAECIATKMGVPIEIIGERIGEKTHETLISYYESVRAVNKYDYYELMPIGIGGESTAFTLASHTPSGWYTPSDMMREIHYATLI